MQKISAFLLVSLIFLGCEHDSIVTPPEPRPEGWVSLGLEDKTVNRLVLAENWLFACAGKDGLYRIKHPASPGDEWQFLGLGDLDVVVPGLFGVTDLVAIEDTLIAAIWSGTETPGIFRSVDDGVTWLVSDSGFVTDRSYPSSGVIRRLVRSPLNSHLLVAGCQGDRVIYLSENLGLSWRLSFSFGVGGEFSFRTVGLHPNQVNEIWAGGVIPNSGLPLLYRSDDSGNSWQKVLEHPHDPYDFPDEVNDIAFDQENDNTVYVCLDRIIIKTTDSGANWFTSLDTVETGVFWNISTNPNAGNELIACATDSLYDTTDRGLIWTAFESAPGNQPPMKDMVIDWDRRILYVSTFNPSRGVFELYF